MTTTPTELSTASAEALLDAMVALTHKIHTLTVYENRGIDATYEDVRLSDLREQRGMVRAELLRRIGDTKAGRGRRGW